MSERTVTFKGMPLALAGNEIKAGDKAPDFSAAANDMSPVSLKDFAGKVLILWTLPPATWRHAASTRRPRPWGRTSRF